MSGLLALLDDVAALAKLAATSVDDIGAAALKSGAKSAGAAIDDAAVTPKYVHGLAPARELPMIWRIARGSIINKLVILLPAALLLAAFAPWAIAPLLALGGLYLCYEGAEKVLSALGFVPHDVDEGAAHTDAAHLEEAKVKGAIKTDFILSAEIMTIALASLPPGSIGFQAAVLALVAVMITVAVYGSVALIVKADDLGLYLAQNGAGRLTRRFGAGLVQMMPRVLSGLTVIGTAAMLWVGGSILVHASAEMGWHTPEHLVQMISQFGNSITGLTAFVEILLYALIAMVCGSTLTTVLSKVNL